MAFAGLTLAPKRFSELTEREILAIAISAEEEDSRIYLTFAEDLDARFPASAKVFREMADEENEHRRLAPRTLRTALRLAFTPDPPRGCEGIFPPPPIWLTRNLPFDTIRGQAELMEFEANRFYTKAADHASDAGIRKLLGDSAVAENRHESQAAKLSDSILTPDVKLAEDETARRVFVLQYVQPGLAGLMDGSVSTLAPLFAAAFATHHNGPTFLVGLAAAIGAGISMGFAEALSDDGSLTGRGSPLLRGGICGAMTTWVASATPCPISCRMLGRMRSGSPPPLPASWCYSSFGRSPISAPVIWIRRSCRRCSRSWSAG